MKRNLNRTGKFVNNLFFATCHQVVVLAVGFIIPRFMLEYYGSEINGLITSITQFIEYFSLVEAGLSSASIFALYKPLSKDDHKGISAIVVATRRFYMISGYIFLALVISFALIYPLTVNIATMGRWQISIRILYFGEIPGSFDGRSEIICDFYFVNLVYDFKYIYISYSVNYESSYRDCTSIHVKRDLTPMCDFVPVFQEELFLYRL